MATPKQEKFARFIVEGMNPSEAYKAAGYKATKPETIATEAQRLLNNPSISPIIEKGKRDAAQVSCWKLSDAIADVRLVKEKALERLQAGRWDGVTVKAFFSALDRLNRFTDAEHVIELRRVEYERQAEKAADPNLMFQILPEPEYTIEAWNALPPLEQIG